jgi:nucleoid DNA-binding protein
MALMKVDILEPLQSVLGPAKKQSVVITAPLLEWIASGLEPGNDRLLSGLNQFCVADNKGRKGWNPATGEDDILSVRRVVTSSRSAELREKVNRK